MIKPPEIHNFAVQCLMLKLWGKHGMSKTEEELDLSMYISG